MSTTVIIPTKNEVIGVRKILPQIKKEWADETLAFDEWVDNELPFSRSTAKQMMHIGLQ